MNIRHGDMALIGTEEIPQGLEKEKSSTNVLMVGSNNNSHSFKNGVFYPQVDGDNLVGYFEAKRGCHLLHPDHGKEQKTGNRIVNVPKGYYKVLRQNEETHDAFKPVVD